MSAIDLYNEFSYYNNQLVLPENPVISSVYIPTIHKNFTNAAIYHVFDALFGCVTRIDNVHIKTKDGTDSKFKSAFVYFIAYNQPTNVMDAIGRNEKVRINPNVNTSYMRTHFPQPNPKIRNSEFWLLLPNNNVVPDTTLTLAQIRDKIDTLVPLVAWDQEEDETLTVNFGFWVELEAKLAGRPNDTSINIHQLTRNIELMEERMAKASQSATALADAKAEADRKAEALVDSVPKVEALVDSVPKAEATIKDLVDLNALADANADDLPDPKVLAEDNDEPCLDTEPLNNSKMDVDTEWKAVKARAKKVIPTKAESESKDEMYDDACNSAERGSRSMGGGYYALWSGAKTETL